MEVIKVGVVVLGSNQLSRYPALGVIPCILEEG